MTNQNLSIRKGLVIARRQSNAYPVYVEHAKNAELWNVKGKRYIDFGTCFNEK
jgi:4-aminobutyrate aminotransferase/(S)-3-amino-2-methylpropionate transaminase